MRQRIRTFWNNSKVWLFVVALMVAIVLTFEPFSLAQSSQISSENELIEQIEKRASNHANAGDSMYPTSIYLEFKDNDFGWERKNILDTYEEKFIEERLRISNKEEESESNLQNKNEILSKLYKILPFLGWVSATLALSLNRAIQSKLSDFFKNVGDRIYYFFAHISWFQSLALKGYRERLRKNLGGLETPFNVDQPLSMSEVNLPSLKLSEDQESLSDQEQLSDQDNELDIYEILKKTQYRRMMVKGDPGSGKSVLLKNIAFKYGVGQLILPDNPVPVRLELNTLKSKDLDEDGLVGKLVESLKENGFPNPDSFVRNGLKKGKLMLLLDGFDEIPSDIRFEAARVIRGILRNNPECRALITCRKAVYDDEFNNELDHNVLDISGFTDYQIRSFLQSWQPRIPKRKSVSQLMQALYERPNIKILARNPLLLTIIAYLYTKDIFELPHSRAEFYEKSTKILLDERDRKRDIHNKYRERKKRQTLRKLALKIQDDSNGAILDHRSISEADVLFEIRDLMPKLGLEVKDSEPILEEIVERSGLLLPVSNKEEYQFAHLTLQEFFAAEALQNNEWELIEYFDRDADLWREVIKLCCGLLGNSTELIREVYVRDELLAFECLAEASEVDQILVTEILENMKGKLIQAVSNDDVAKAFGMVAADSQSRSRSKYIFVFLNDQLSNNSDFETRCAAAKALSKTHLPKAASLLAKHFYQTNEPIISELIDMGDVAVDPLFETANNGHLQSIDSLYRICTPSSANALVKLLWNKNTNVAIRAACRLATLLKHSDIEKNLVCENIPPNRNSLNSNNWIWLPFTSKGSDLLIITGRIVQLLCSAETHEDIFWEIASQDSRRLLKVYADPRLIIPICSIQINPFEQLSPENIREIRVNLVSEDDISEELSSYPSKRDFIDHLLQEPDKDLYWSKLMRGLKTDLQIKLLYRLATCSKNRLPTKQDWINLLKPVKFEFATSWWSYWLILGVASLASLGAVARFSSWQIFSENSFFLSLTVHTLAALFIFSIIFFWLTLGYKSEQSSGESFKPQIFRKLGTFGIWILGKQIWRLHHNPSNAPFWEGVRLSNAVLNSGEIGWITLTGAAIAGVGSALHSMKLAKGTLGQWLASGVPEGILGLDTESIALTGIMLLTLTWAVPVVATNSEHTESNSTTLIRTLIVAVFGPIIIVGLGGWLGMNISLVALITSAIASVGAIGMAWMMLANQTDSSLFIIAAATTMLAALLGVGADSGGEAIAPVLVAAILGVLFGNASVTLNAAAENTPNMPAPLQKVLVLCTFPVFSWLPITWAGASWGLHSWLQFDWLSTIWISLGVIASCWLLWCLGRKREREASNPLHGILP